MGILLRRLAWLALADVAALAWPSLANAQVPPPSITAPAGFENESRRQQSRIEQQIARPPVLPESATQSAAPRNPTATADAGGPTFQLKGVTFDSSTFLARAELNGAVAKYIGKAVSLGDLQRMVDGVNKLYSDRRIVTAVASLPPQNVATGVVHIKLTEGRMGNLTLSGNSYTNENFVRDRITIPPGTVIDPAKLTADVIRFNRLHEVQVKALLQPGSTFGLSDVQLSVREPAVNTLQIFADNQGVKSTGKYQVGGFYRRNGLFGIDDRFTVYATDANKTLNGNAAYNLAVGPYGSRLGVSYSRGSMTIINGPYKSLNVEGESQTGAINASHPLLANERWLILANASASYGTSQTTYSKVLVTDDDVIKETAGVSVSYYGDNYVLNVAPAMNNVESYSNILNTWREFRTFTGTGSATVQLPHDLKATSSFSWQVATSDLLPGAQLFQIGGPTTVRGYPVNSVAGDKGYLVNLELHRDVSALAKGLDTFVFLDHGGTYSTRPTARHATSAGVGLAWTAIANSTIELTAAKALTELVPGQAPLEIYGRLTWRPQL